jgi:hypothetical protein
MILRSLPIDSGPRRFPPDGNSQWFSSKSVESAAKNGRK